MRKALFVFLFIAPAAFAQNWSIGGGTGPFVFGQFVERTSRITTGDAGTTQTITLSAATRPGLVVDIERRLGERFAVRVEGTFTRSPLAIKGTNRQDPTVSLPAGDIDVVTLAVPLVVRINPRGTFRFHVMGGPASAAYTIRNRENAAGNIPTFRGTRDEWGAVLGAGVAWQWTEYFAIEGNASNISTSSPFRREEIGGLGSIDIPRSNHLHTNVGLRYRF